MAAQPSAQHAAVVPAGWLGQPTPAADSESPFAPPYANPHLHCHSLRHRTQILNHFGALQPDTAQKQRYAAWRAAEINKAVKEGRQPDPPPVARQDTDEEAAMLDELAKLEMAGASSASITSSASAPAGGAPSVPSAADGDWAPPGAGGVPTSSQPIPPPPPPFEAPGGWDAGQGGGGGGSGDSGDFDLPPSPPKSRPIDTQGSRGVWLPPPPRRFQTFQKARTGL